MSELDFKHCEWQPIRLYAEGRQPLTARYWNCLPALDINAVHTKADEIIRHPDALRADADPEGDYPGRELTKYAFSNRHIDPRFYIEYPLSSRTSPRVMGQTIGDPEREWDVLIEHRDRYLAAAGLSLSSPQAEIARCLAESFAGYSHFKDKPMCCTFPENERALEHPIEGLLHKSYCVGCAMAFAALADASGLPARVLSMEGHVVAEVCVNGCWHLVDSIARHSTESKLELYFDSSFVETQLDPMGNHGRRITDSYRNGLWKRGNPRIHLMGSSWLSCMTLHYTAQTAHALYPESKTPGIQSEDGRRLPIIKRGDGFFYPRVHRTLDNEPTRIRRLAAVPMRMPQKKDITWDFLYHPFRKGQKIRESIFLSSLEDMEGVEIIIGFGASRSSDFSEAAGSRLRLRLGDFSATLTELQSWPPTVPDETGNVHCRLFLPADLFRKPGFHYIEIIHQADSVYYLPCVPAYMEPYQPPLWS